MMAKRVLLVLACLLLGFAAGRGLRPDPAPAVDVGAGPPRAVAAGHADATEDARQRLSAPGGARAAGTGVAVPFHAPSDLAEFHARLDEVVAAAREGSTPAALSLWEYLLRCDGDTSRDLRNQRRWHKREVAELEQQAATLEPEVLASRVAQRDRQLRNAEDLDALCGDLGDQRGTALGWLELAMARGSADAVPAVMGVLAQRLDGPARSRYAERLLRLRDQALQRVQHGDMSRGPEAPRLMMLAYNSGMLPFDEAERAGYQHAWWRAGQDVAEEDQWFGPDPLADDKLTPAQRTKAERIGRQAYESCCT